MDIVELLLELLKGLVPLIVGCLEAVIIYVVDWLVCPAEEEKAGNEAFELRTGINRWAGLGLGLGTIGFGCYTMRLGWASPYFLESNLYFILGILVGLVTPVALFAAIRFRIVVSSEGLVKYGLFRRRPLKIAWGEIASFTHSRGRYVARTLDGKTMRIEDGLSGIGRFFDAYHRWLSPAVYGKVLGN